MDITFQEPLIHQNLLIKNSQTEKHFFKYYSVFNKNLLKFKSEFKKF